MVNACIFYCYAVFIGYEVKDPVLKRRDIKSKLNIVIVVSLFSCLTAKKMCKILVC